MKKCRWAIGGMMVLVFLCWAASSPAADEKAAPDEKAAASGEAVFDMKEISLFDQKATAGIPQRPASGGQSTSLGDEPAKEVKAYPKLNSKHPLYGSIVFNRGARSSVPLTKFHFVLDESAATDKDKADDKAAKSDADKPAAEKPKRHYDRLYFDLNHDLDLTNDGVVSPMKDPPTLASRLTSGPRTSVVFDTINVPLGDDSKAKGQTVRMAPAMDFYETSGRGVLTFMMGSARKGEIRLGKRAFNALLFASGGVGVLDRPNTQLVLTPVEGAKTSSFSFLNTLGAIRCSDGEYYQISATPSGDKLTVRVFPGDRGAFELSAAKKDIKPLGMVGLLRWKDSMIPLGEFSYPMGSQRATTAKYQLPAGDYQPLILLVDYGNLQVSLRSDYTRNASRGSKSAGGIEIRKDKPYVLDLTGKPEVNFQSPPQGKSFKPGDAIRLSAMIKIPEKSLLITGLNDMSKKVGEMRWVEDGKPVTIPRYASLDPTVVITDSSGKKVAEGTMPFG
jgi:hypothetical protein